MHITLPEEIRRFFNQKGGRSLLIKGAPGSGKTTLALQLMEELVEINRGFYISTRVSDDAIFSQFPWLQEKEWRDRLIDITKDFLREVTPEPKEIPDIKVLKAKEILTTLEKSDKRGVENRTWLLQLIQEAEVREVENLYDRIQSILPGKCMVVIDSIDGMGEKYKIPYGKIVEAMQKDLVEETGVNMVVICESENATPIDYLVDGIICLNMRRLGMSVIRELEMKKMRGIKIANPYYLFTMVDGKLTVLSRIEKKEKERRWQIIPNGVENYSTGLKEIDTFYGGIAPGDVIFIESEPTVPEDSIIPLILSPVANFLSQGHGVMLIPPLAITMKHLVPVINVAGENVEHLRIFLKSHESSSEKHIVRMPYMNSMEDYQIWLESYSILLREAKKPFLLVVGLDTQESAYSANDLMDVLMQIVEHARTKHDILILCTKLKGVLNTAASAICKTHIELHEQNGHTFLTGHKRRTGTYWLRNVPRKYIDDIELVPML